MKLNRNSKKWKELYLERLIESVTIEHGAAWYVKKSAIDKASKEQIKEAEEYADRLFSAMR